MCNSRLHMAETCLAFSQLTCTVIYCEQCAKRLFNNFSDKLFSKRQLNRHEKYIVSNCDLTLFITLNTDNPPSMSIEHSHSYSAFNQFLAP